MRNLTTRDTEVTEFDFEPRQSGSRAALQLLLKGGFSVVHSGINQQQT